MNTFLIILLIVAVGVSLYCCLKKKKNVTTETTTQPVVTETTTQPVVTETTTTSNYPLYYFKLDKIDDYETCTESGNFTQSVPMTVDKSGGIYTGHIVYSRYNGNYYRAIEFKETSYDLDTTYDIIDTGEYECKK